MVEVRIKAEKLKDEIQGRSESGFLKYLLRHNKEEPVIIGPGGIFYVTDHHHLARALYQVGASTTYCTIVDNLSDAKVDDFWKHLKENNEVYLEDQNGNPIKPDDLPTSVKDLRNDPFRSLAGAVRESCVFEKNHHDSVDGGSLCVDRTDLSLARDPYTLGQFPPCRGQPVLLGAAA